MLLTVPMICEPIAGQPVSFCQNDFSHLAGIELADSSNGHESLEVDLLIGSDHYWDLVTGDVRRGSSGPVAICTKLGWVLSGPTSSHLPDTPTACFVTHTLRVDGLSEDSQMLDDRLKSFWDLESFGITDQEQQSVHDDFGATIQFVGGRYEVQLPWKEDRPTLPDHYQLCVKRLHSLGNRLKQDPAILREYDATIRGQIQQGIVEPVKPIDEELDLVHYLPHHAVVRQDKVTTKVCIVYDASARTTGPSLNDCLHVGPKLNQKILEILLRFRIHRIAVTADIEKAFLMVSMAKKDRNVLRFLWFKDACADQQELMELRFTRVVFRISSSPFLLNATLRHHLDQYESSHPVLTKKLRQSLYVDDVAFGAANEEQAYQMFMTSKDILRDAGFNLRKFHSNSAMLQARVNRSESTSLESTPATSLETPPATSLETPPATSLETTPATSLEMTPTTELEESYTASTLGTRQELHSGEQKVLGVCWDTTTDRLLINLEEIASIAKALTPTKRSIVSLAGRFYDPIGYLAPVVVQFKIFLRELSLAKIDWDQHLPSELMTTKIILLIGVHPSARLCNAT